MGNRFFDVHCHLFNIVDVPLWETLSGAVRMHTLIGLASILAGESILQQHRYFLRFFERSTETNLLWLAEQIREALNSNPEMSAFLGSPKGIVITPLIMDFDTHIEKLPCMPGDESVESQYHRLDHAIAECHAALASAGTPVHAFPFMGVALDKLNNDDPHDHLAKVKDWWATNGLTKAERALPWEQMPQKALGIKLYPALGFQPYPSDRDKAKYMEFYQWCVSNDIPITVHCQPGAFDPDRPTGVDTNSSPRYWQKVLETNGLSELRINFAHFGGGDNLPGALDESGQLNKHNETAVIVELLQKYPNTYADLAAIDFHKPAIKEAFAELLSRDLHEEHGQHHSICTKLIWGSDVPMVIASPQYQQGPGSQGPEMGYVHCLNYFKNALGRVRSIESGIPDCLSQAKQKQLMIDITSNNPERFLHGTS
jgi:hypothetical protein